MKKAHPPVRRVPFGVDIAIHRYHIWPRIDTGCSDGTPRLEIRKIGSPVQLPGDGDVIAAPGHPMVSWAGVAAGRSIHSLARSHLSA
ncbi:hypothetical protein [Hypericibacter sp.]|uniref:hypothetical protein n=1 Tax=Hypericibacter sp. TaxID=2705401 RepID=UPI003D6C72F0